MKYFAATALALLCPLARAQVFTSDPNWPPAGSEYDQEPGAISSPEGYSLRNVVLGNPTGTPVALKKGLNAVNVKLAFTLEGDEGTPDGSSTHFSGELDLSGSVSYTSSNNGVDRYDLSIDSFEGIANAVGSSAMLFRIRKRPELLYQAWDDVDLNTGRVRMSSFFDIFVELETPSGLTTDPSDSLRLSLQPSTATPEPVTLSVFGLGLMALVRRRR